jgi:hypothetical protein
LFCSMGRTSLAKKDRSSAPKLCVDFCGAATDEVVRQMRPKIKTRVEHGRRDTRTPSKGASPGKRFEGSDYWGRIPLVKIPVEDDTGAQVTACSCLQVGNTECVTESKPSTQGKTVASSRNFRQYHRLYSKKRRLQGDLVQVFEGFIRLFSVIQCSMIEVESHCVKRSVL